MKSFRRYFWDSGVFVSFLCEEQGRWKIVEELLNQCRSGEGEIIISSFAYVEVLRLKGQAPMTQADQRKLELFFDQDFIKPFNADRFVCERARFYVWKHKFKPKDAVHMATAEAANKIVPIHEIFSWDSDFTRCNGKTDLKIPIVNPYISNPGLGLQFDTENDSDQTIEEPDIDF